MNYHFQFSAEVLNIVLAGLRKLPFEQSASLLQALGQEIEKQEAQAKASAKPDSPADVVTEQTDKPKRKYTRKAANGAAEDQPSA